MKRTVTFNRNGDFKRLYARGKVYAAPELVIYLMKNHAGLCRMGITVGKKVGNAVGRNRAKRLIRAAYAEIEEEIAGTWDFVFVARSRTKELKSADVEGAMSRLLRDAGAMGK